MKFPIIVKIKIKMIHVMWIKNLVKNRFYFISFHLFLQKHLPIPKDLETIFQSLANPLMDNKLWSDVLTIRDGLDNCAIIDGLTWLLFTQSIWTEKEKESHINVHWNHYKVHHNMWHIGHSNTLRLSNMSLVVVQLTVTPLAFENNLLYLHV